MAENDLSTWIRQKITAEVVIAFVLGVFIGLVVLGWWLWPVNWTNTDAADLKPGQKEVYLQMIADSYALTRDSETAVARLQGLKAPGEEDADLSAMLAALIKARTEAGESGEVTRLEGLSSAVILPPPPSPKPTAAGLAALDRSQALRIGGVVFFLALLGTGTVLLLSQLQKREAVRRRRPYPSEQPVETAGEEPEVIAPIEPEGTLGRFETTYSLGDEAYDLSYSIESSAGEFLGECGLSALEEVGLGEPGGASAFELWLFDKEDVRTETKVLMSEQAFGDEVLRDRLAARGALVLAEPGKVVTVETANLRLDATVSELEYESPSNSVFAKVTAALEISRR